MVVSPDCLRLVAMISAAEAKVEEPDLKKPRLDGGPPPPPPTPPPVPALKPNGAYGMQELISQMAARGVAKPPPGMALPPQMPPGMPAMGMRPGMMPQPMVNMPCQNCQMPLPPPPGCGPCGPCGPRVGGCCGSCMLPLPGPPATGKPIFLAPATVSRMQLVGSGRNDYAPTIAHHLGCLTSWNHLRNHNSDHGPQQRGKI